VVSKMYTRLLMVWVAAYQKPRPDPQAVTHKVRPGISPAVTAVKQRQPVSQVCPPAHDLANL